MTSKAVDETESLSAEERRALRAWIKEAGDHEVAEISGASRMTLMRAAGGFEIRRGSVVLVRAALRRRARARE